ncbi:hypothetical protein J2Y45_001445 [Dyadobacter sp. BE34]|uniref:Uncharacterized protein n=1 Tax=Dyadobacter fermentans TaxID=94254 RepID=A0ABU1QSQ1_9BACT|nr:MULTISPECIES: hypothetical protein [Dyadobacter]MDR6804176.1 hypothetical protein [Dyadobacter fermentans]MDR7041916.1 hypothetical protein [Dyadobacter sp. BE242]MDR7196319.1 hypothetical protein [Dyadobacter sp. BE34]MDR7213136.1 hypothetical protein [Dyadobacter sp. BE31]MDR7261725.1 hypothetical protein [Dyadobacter sp. BE32]
MKNIEDKLDGFEQILAILVKKISVMESVLIDPKAPVDDLARQMLAEIQASVAKMPSGNMMLSELAGIRKHLETLSYALENPKPVTFNFKAKSYLASSAVLLCTTAASLVTVRCSYEKIDQASRTEARYEVAQQLSPRLTRMIDQAFDQTATPSVDSLWHVWESLDLNSRKLDDSRRKR